MVQVLNALGGPMQVLRLLESKKPNVAQRAALALSKATVVDLNPLPQEFWTQLASHLLSSQDTIIVSSIIRTLANIAWNIVSADSILHQYLIDSKCTERVCTKALQTSDTSMQLQSIVILGNLVCGDTRHSEILWRTGVFQKLVHVIFEEDNGMRESALNTVINCTDSECCAEEFTRLKGISKVMQLIRDIDQDHPEQDKEYLYSCFMLMISCLRKSQKAVEAVQSCDGIAFFFKLLSSCDAILQQHALEAIEGMMHEDKSKAALCLEIGRSGILRTVIWLLGHEKTIVADKAQLFVQTLQHSLPKLAILLVEQDCVPIVFRLLKSPFCQQLVYWIQNQISGQVLTTLLSTIKTISANKVLRRNIAIGLIYLCKSGSKLSQTLVRMEEMDKMISLLDSKATRLVGIEFLQTIESLIEWNDGKAVRPIVSRDRLDGLLTFQLHASSTLVIKKQTLVSTSKYFANLLKEDATLSEYVVPEEYSIECMEQIIASLPLGLIDQQLFLKTKIASKNQLMEIFQFAYEYQCPVLLETTGYALSDYMSVKDLPILFKKSTEYHHPALMIRCFRFLLSHLETHPNILVSTRQSLRSFLIELFH